MTDHVATPQTRPLWLTVVSASVMAWCGLIYAAATIPKAVDPFNIPSLCGPWGCTAETNDLVAYHLVWLAATVPIAGVLASKYRSERLTRIGRRIMLGVLVIAIATIITSSIYWRYTHGSEHEPWPWRYGLFLMFASADIPILPTFFCGLAASLLGRPSSPAASEPTDQLLKSETSAKGTVSQA